MIVDIDKLNEKTKLISAVNNIVEFAKNRNLQINLSCDFIKDKDGNTISFPHTGNEVVFCCPLGLIHYSCDMNVIDRDTEITLCHATQYNMLKLLNCAGIDDVTKLYLEAVDSLFD